jgi:GMP synthase (glutamine-hydrolysing)
VVVTISDKNVYGLLEKISNRITNEINDATWVTYVISSKPPATIEPQ